MKYLDQDLKITVHNTGLNYTEWKYLWFRYHQDVEADVGGVADFEKVIEKLKEINTNYLDKSKETNIVKKPI